MFVFTFPGQGSQKTGMGLLLYQTFSSVKDVFHEIDDALKQKLSTLIFEGAESDLRLTTNTQPALFAVSMAVLRCLEQDFGWNTNARVSFVAGHSLGEYAALACAGGISIADGARLLRVRGDAMNTAAQKHPGRMAAVLGLEIAHIQSALKAFENTCVLANDNCPGQVVISGTESAVADVSAQLTELGAKRVMPLNVSGAFHSPFMKSAEEPLQKAIEQTNFTPVNIPVITNVSAQPISDVDLIKQHLRAQICGSVRWTESMTYALNAQPEAVVELGSGKVLTGLLGRINQDAKGISLETPQDIENFATTYS